MVVVGVSENFLSPFLERTSVIRARSLAVVFSYYYRVVHVCCAWEKARNSRSSRSTVRPLLGHPNVYMLSVDS